MHSEPNRISRCSIYLPGTRLARIAAALVACGLAAGCASFGDIAGEAIKANLAFERQNNHLLLLNVVRASYDMPMHFSRINAVRLTAGTAGSSLKASLPTLGLAQAVNTSLIQRGGLELSIGGPALPAIDVTPLDGQEFVQGVMAPVPLTILPVLSELGWPTELLMHLLVDSFEVGSGTTGTQYQNDPRSSTYQRFVEELQAQVPDRECVIFSSKDAKQKLFSPVYGIGDPKPAIQGVAAAKEAKLSLEIDGNGNYSYGVPTLIVDIRCPKVVATSVPSLQRRSTNSLRFALRDEGPAPEVSPSKTTAYLRSPQGVLYYLGLLVRKQREGVLITMSDKRSIFPVIHNGVQAEALAKVSLAGQDHVVLVGGIGGVGGYGAASLSIAWQVLQLQSKGAAPPVTGTVRLAP